MPSHKTHLVLCGRLHPHPGMGLFQAISGYDDMGPPGLVHSLALRSKKAPLAHAALLVFVDFMDDHAAHCRTHTGADGATAS